MYYGYDPATDHYFRNDSFHFETVIGNMKAAAFSAISLLNVNLWFSYVDDFLKKILKSYL